MLSAIAIRDSLPATLPRAAKTGNSALDRSGPFTYNESFECSYTELQQARHRIRRNSGWANNTVRGNMKAHLIAASALVVLSACTSTPPSLSSAKRVIVPTAYLPFGGTGHAMPTDDEIRTCEQALAYRLAKEGFKLSNYYLRLGAEIRDGRRFLSGVAAHKEAPGSERYLQPASDDGPIFLLTFGGGKGYFAFTYDAQRRKLVKFDFNAPL